MYAIEQENSLLLFRVGPVHCCASPSEVESLHNCQQAEHNRVQRIGAHFVKIIDLAYCFGIEQEHRSGQLIICHTQAGYYGLWVDQIIAVTQYPASGWKNLSQHFNTTPFQRSLVYGDRIYLHTQLEQLCHCGKLSTLMQSRLHLLNSSNSPECDSITSNEISAQHHTLTAATCAETKRSSEAGKSTGVTAAVPKKARTVTKPAVLIHKPKPVESKPTGKAVFTPFRQPKTELPVAEPASHLSTDANRQKDIEALHLPEPEQNNRNPWLIPLATFALISIAAGSLLLTFTAAQRKEFAEKPDESNLHSAKKPSWLPKLDYDSRNPKPSLEENSSVLRKEKHGYTIVLKQADHSTNVATSDKNTLSPQTVIHIVKKGDTLWHIAKRYVRNPYHYPELARLSDIKNPNLIHPGDRIRIIGSLP